MCLLDEGRLLLGFFGAHALVDEFLDFGFVVLVEGYIEVTDEVVALLAGGLGRSAVAPLEPSEHRFADVDATVVNDVGLNDFVAVGLHDFREAVAQQIVAHMAQVQRLVGVGRGILNHHQLTVVGDRREAVIGRLGDVLEHTGPERRLDGDVEEALDDVEFLYRFAVSQHVLTDFLCRHIGRLVRRLQEREHYNRLVALELLLGGLRNNLLGGEIHTIQFFHSQRCSLGKYIIYRHNL